MTPKLNIINRALLKAMMLPASLYKKAGANVPMLDTILRYKLAMDDRRPNTFQTYKSDHKEKPITLATIGSMIMALFLGLIYIVSFFVSDDLLTCGLIYFSMYIVMLALTLITDFTQVLIDVRDNFIILPKPVTGNTFIISRILHITIHVCKIMIPMALPGILTVGIKFGPMACLGLCAGLLMATLFTIFLINAVYLLVLRLSSPHKFRNIIAGIQIVFVIVVYGAYQLVPRYIASNLQNGLEVSRSPGWLMAPPYWFASLFHVFTKVSENWVVWLAVGLALAMPVLGIVVVVRYFAPTFIRKLGQIAGSGGEATPAPATQKALRGASYSQVLAKALTKPGVERMSFLFSWRMMLRSRDFKLKVYPGIGYLLVIFAVSVLRNSKGLDRFASSLILDAEGSRFTITILLYISGFVSVSALQQLAHSENFQAGWIFRSSPLPKPGPLVAGSILAVMAQFQIPAFFAIGLPLLILNGWAIAVHLFTAFSGLCLVLGLVAMLSQTHLPWTVPVNKQDQGGSVLRVLLLMMGLALIGIFHGVLFYYAWAIALLGLLFAVFAALILKALRGYNWGRISTYRY